MFQNMKSNYYTTNKYQNNASKFLVIFLIAVFFIYLVNRAPLSSYASGFYNGSRWEEKSFNEIGILPPFFNFYENYRIAPKYNLATCQIQKSLSTLRASIFCLLWDSQGFIKDNRSISEQHWHNLYCGNKNEVYTIEKVADKLGEPFNNFAVVREPIDRFVSGFVDKCVNRGFDSSKSECYGCGKDIECFIDIQYKRFMGFLNGNLEKKEAGFEDIHFAPQTWYCRFDRYFNSYELLRYENGKDIIKMSNHLQKILRNNGVESNLLRMIEKETLKGKTYHTTKGSSVRTRVEAELFSSPDLLEKLTKMYYYDFIIFNYPFPKSIVDRIF